MVLLQRRHTEKGLSHRFVGYIELPEAALCKSDNYKADTRQGVAVEYVSCEPTESARELFDEEYEPVEEEG